MITPTQEENTRKEKEEKSAQKKKSPAPGRITLHGESRAIAVTLFTEVRSAGEPARACVVKRAQNNVCASVLLKARKNSWRQHVFPRCR